MISVKKLDKYYNRGRENQIHVINDLSVELPERGMVAVFGKSGCGKTTLLNVIGGLDSFSGGSVEIFGEDVRKNTDDIRNRYIGYIFQNYNLNRTQTVEENVADSLRLCGMKDQSEISRRVGEALRNVGMEMYRRRTPDTLSGGQQQRVAIARAIVKNPRIILADEPTGNLDEENTVMVMDLLRGIAEDHLVVLVTHEQNLVDYYCDRVIELSDGRISSVRENGVTGGYSAKNRNDIYLGDLEKSSGGDGRTEITYFGPDPGEPLRLRVVNYNGRTYVRIDTPDARIIDDTSEIRLREGSFDQRRHATEKSRVDMSGLPPVSCTKTGSLFTFLSSVKSGYKANFSRGTGRHRAKRPFILTVMAVFSLVMVVLTAVLGQSVKSVQDISRSYNHNLVYVYTPEESVRLKLEAAKADPESRIDYSLCSYGRAGDERVNFSVGSFESFSQSRSYFSPDSLETHGVCVPWELLEGKKVLAGKATQPSDGEIIISSAMADILLEKSTFSYIGKYSDLMGLVWQAGGYYDWNSGGYRLCGIVDCDEYLFSISGLRAAERTISSSGMAIYSSSGIYVEAPSDSEIVVVTNLSVMPAESVPPVMKIAGKNYTVKAVYDSEDYNKLQPEGQDGKYNYYDYAVFMSDAEFIRAANSFEPSGPEVYNDYYYNYAKRPNEAKPKIFIPGRYTVLHSSDPKTTAEYVHRILPDLETGDPGYEPVVTPEDARMESASDKRAEITRSFITIGVFTGVMCLCMYMIMRSSLMSRIKEIGIYRAIGVSRRNVLFRFLIESAVLTTLTVFVTYIIGSAGLFYLQSVSKSILDLFYYPVWLAACLLVFQYALCLLCGTAPVMALLRRTPSDILAKYDI